MNGKLRVSRWPIVVALCAGSWASGALAQAVDGTDTDISTDQVVEQTLQQRTNPGLAYGAGPCPYGYGGQYGMMGPGMGMMGPGMMGPGMGMMGPGMMGPGMMGGPGMGYPGMMGPGMGMMGPGMMGPGRGMMMGPMMSEFAMLDLSPDQQGKISQIQQETLQKHLGLRQQVRSGQLQLRQLLLQDKPDPQAVGDAYSKIAQLQRQLIESRVEAHNRMESLLTDQQRQQLQQNRRMMMGPMYGPGQGAPGQGTPGQ